MSTMGQSSKRSSRDQLSGHAEACHTSDTDASKALLAEVFKLLGNSAYRKMIEAVKH